MYVYSFILFGKPYKSRKEGNRDVRHAMGASFYMCNKPFGIYIPSFILPTNTTFKVFSVFYCSFSSKLVSKRTVEYIAQVQICFKAESQ